MVQILHIGTCAFLREFLGMVFASLVLYASMLEQQLQAQRGVRSYSGCYRGCNMGALIQRSLRSQGPCLNTELEMRVVSQRSPRTMGTHACGHSSGPEHQSRLEEFCGPSLCSELT